LCHPVIVFEGNLSFLFKVPFVLLLIVAGLKLPNKKKPGDTSVWGDTHNIFRIRKENTCIWGEKNNKFV